MGFRPSWDGGPLERWGPTESGLGEEATPHLCLLAAGQGCVEQTGKCTIVLVLLGACFPTRLAGSFEVFFFRRVSCVWLFSVAARAGRAGVERGSSKADCTETCWQIYRRSLEPSPPPWTMQPTPQKRAVVMGRSPEPAEHWACPDWPPGHLIFTSLEITLPSCLGAVPLVSVTGCHAESCLIQIWPVTSGIYHRQELTSHCHKTCSMRERCRVRGGSHSG